MMPGAADGGRFSALLLQGLDHYRKGEMLEAVRVWEEAYLLEPTNLRAREFLRSALERIHAHMSAQGTAKDQSAPGAGTSQSAAGGAGQSAAAAGQRVPTPHPWLRAVGAQVAAAAQAAQPAAPSASAAGSLAGSQPSASPWDDGPSLALPQETSAPEDTSGAWSIHRETPLPLPQEDQEIFAWAEGARELVALNDFSGALELAKKILSRRPNDPEALKLQATCEENLIQMYESKLGSMARVPRVVLPPDEIIWLNLDPRAGFVLAQIDGAVSFEDLYAICGLRRLDTARILSQLLEEGVIAAQDDQLALRRGAASQPQG